MKNFLVWSLILLFQSSFCQKKFHLDYALEFENEVYLKKDKKKHTKKVYLVNSMANNYILFLDKSDSLLVSFNFIDQDGIAVNATVDKNLFLKSITITSDCKNVVGYKNPYKFQVDNYEFVNLTDTIINNTSYYHYYIKSNKSLKYQKRKKIATIHYIVDKNSPEFLPFLLVPTCYEEWKKERNIPNGSPFIIYHKNLKGEITLKMQLKSLVKIDKYLAVPDECDYTKIE